jgi:hypothetical protein
MLGWERLWRDSKAIVLWDEWPCDPCGMVESDIANGTSSRLREEEEDFKHKMS